MVLLLEDTFVEASIEAMSKEERTIVIYQCMHTSFSQSDANRTRLLSPTSSGILANSRRPLHRAADSDGRFTPLWFHATRRPPAEFKRQRLGKTS